MVRLIDNNSKDKLDARPITSWNPQTEYNTQKPVNISKTKTGDKLRRAFQQFSKYWR